jgi:DNA-binding NarL/FixJ family response regulator
MYNIFKKRPRQDKNYMIQSVKVALVDDHELIRQGLSTLVVSLGYICHFEANNGQQMIEKLNKIDLPDIILLDINMPEMDGFETIEWLNKHFPNIKILILSMYDNEEKIKKALLLGAKGYLLKDARPEELNEAIDTVMSKGYYYPNFLTEERLDLLNDLKKLEESFEDSKNLTINEIEFLQLVCSGTSYNEVAKEMRLSRNETKNLRNGLLKKLNVKNQIELRIYAQEKRLFYKGKLENENIVQNQIKQALSINEESDENRSLKNGLSENKNLEECFPSVANPTTAEEPKQLQNEFTKQVMKTINKEQIASLSNLSTSILPFINHDLSNCRTVIFYALTQIKEALKQKEGKERRSDLSEIFDFIEKGLKATTAITSIINLIRSYSPKNRITDTIDLGKLFVSRPVDVIEIIRQRFNEAEIIIDKTSPKALEIVYPPNILLATISELTVNAKKVTNKKLKILVNWRIEGNVFHCEFHDNGPGFLNQGDYQFVPIDFLISKGKISETGMGLKIINRTIIESGGNLFFSNSKLFNGGLVYFKFPVLDFFNKIDDDNENK